MRLPLTPDLTNPSARRERKTDMSDVTPTTIPDGLMAMTDDNGTVVTLLKRDPEHGAVYRHDGAWHPLVDPTVLNDLAFVGVTASSEPIYDKYEKIDQLVTIGHYLPTTEGPQWTEVVQGYEEPEHASEIDYAALDEASEEDEVEEEPAEESEEVPEPEEDEEDEEAVTAALTLDGPGDLQNAISAALLNKDLRWFVERRVAALGIEAELPWQKD